MPNKMHDLWQPTISHHWLIYPFVNGRAWHWICKRVMLTCVLNVHVKQSKKINFALKNIICQLLICWMHDFWYVYLYNKFHNMYHWGHKLTFAFFFKIIIIFICCLLVMLWLNPLLTDNHVQLKRQGIFVLALVKNPWQHEERKWKWKRLKK